MVRVLDPRAANGDVAASSSLSLSSSSGRQRHRTSACQIVSLRPLLTQQQPHSRVTERFYGLCQWVRKTGFERRAGSKPVL